MPQSGRRDRTMNKQILEFVNVLIDCGLIVSVGEALVLSRLTTPGYRGQDWSHMVNTAAIRAAHKK